MKSFLSSLCALAVALFLVGCGGTADDTTDVGAPEPGHDEAMMDGEHAEEGEHAEAAEGEAAEGEAAEGEAAEGEAAEGEAAEGEAAE